MQASPPDAVNSDLDARAQAAFATLRRAAFALQFVSRPQAQLAERSLDETADALRADAHMAGSAACKPTLERSNR